MRRHGVECDVESGGEEFFAFVWILQLGQG